MHPIITKRYPAQQAQSKGVVMLHPTLKTCARGDPQEVRSLSFIHMCMLIYLLMIPKSDCVRVCVCV